jgi:hypothetical protein
MVVRIYNLSTWDHEFKGYLWLQSEFKTTMDYIMRTCLHNPKKIFHCDIMTFWYMYIIYFDHIHPPLPSLIPSPISYPWSPSSSQIVGSYYWFLNSKRAKGLIWHHKLVRDTSSPPFHSVSSKQGRYLQKKAPILTYLQSLFLFIF